MSESFVENEGDPVRGSTSVVIGGSAGIGFAVAQMLDRQGSDVVIAGRSRERMRHALDQLSSRTRVLESDVCDEPAVRELFAMLGSVDHVVVTAAEVRGGRVMDTDVDLVRSALDTRVWGSYLVAKHAGPRMTPGGSLTLVSGMLAVRPSVGMAVVSASTAATEAMTRTLALELAPIRVNAVRPGLIDTPLSRRALGVSASAALRGHADRVPARRIGRARDVASVIGELIRNPYLTGVVIPVDGGESLL